MLTIKYFKNNFNKLNVRYEFLSQRLYHVLRYKFKEFKHYSKKNTQCKKENKILKFYHMLVEKTIE